MRIPIRSSGPVRRRAGSGVYDRHDDHPDGQPPLPDLPRLGVRYRPSRRAVAYSGSLVPGVTLRIRRPGRWWCFGFDEIFVTVEDPAGLGDALTELGIDRAVDLPA